MYAVYLQQIFDLAHSRFENKMVASAIFITDTKGKVIIARNYRGDIPMAASEK